MVALNTVSADALQAPSYPGLWGLPSPRATPACPCLRHIEKMAVAASQTLNQDPVSEARDAEKSCPTQPVSPVDIEVRPGGGGGGGGNPKEDD